MLRVVDGARQLTLRIETGTEGTTQLLLDGKVVQEVPKNLPSGRTSQIEFANYDDRAVGHLNGVKLFSYDYDGEALPLTSFGLRAPVRQRVQFGAEAAQVSFDRIRLDRDIYWVNAHEETFGHRMGPYKLAEDEYFVLGDNSPASSDSRSALWARPGVSRSHIVGQTFFVFWPVHVIKWLNGGDESSRPADENNEIKAAGLK
jgi:signal peptidase I